MFDHPDFDNHEEVVLLDDPVSGLRAVIAIHSLDLGPALGGLRWYPYADPADAVGDALRLSRGMTYKNALAGLGFGGGKATVIGDRRTKSRAQLETFAEALNRLGGRYITAEDSGVGEDDIDIIRTVSPFATGGSDGAGDPSPWTAEGVFLGLLTAAQVAFGSADLAGCRVGVLGLGSVGWRLAARLHEVGASLVVADLDGSRTRAAAERFGARVVAPDALPFEEISIFAPCALGGALTPDFVERTRVRVVAGAANNQLADPSVDTALDQAGILYAPDYAINAGGVMSVAAEAAGELDEDALMAQVHEIPRTLARIFARARAAGKPPGAMADLMAMERINAARAAA